jgi:hypothetical protein
MEGLTSVSSQTSEALICGQRWKKEIWDGTEPVPPVNRKTPSVFIRVIRG